MRPAIIFLLVVCLASGGIAQQYSIVPLDSNGYRSAALAVNRYGDVVGYSQSSSAQPPRATLWHGGEPSYFSFPFSAASVAVDINDRGQVVGWSEEVFSGSRQAVSWQDGRSRALPEPDWPWPSGSEATAINNNGQITGNSWHFNYTPSNGFRLVSRAIRWPTLASFELAPFYDFLSSTVSDVNNAGVMVGQNDTRDGQQLVFVWSGESIIELDLGLSECTAGAISDDGTVVGWYRFGYDRAFIWTPEYSWTLPILPGVVASRARAVSAGLIVGEVEFPGGVIEPCFWTDRAATPTLLNSLIDSSLGWQLTSVMDVNPSGQLVGSGFYRGRPTGYLMTPVPEPSSGMVLAVSFVWLSWRRVRPRRP